MFDELERINKGVIHAASKLRNSDRKTKAAVIALMVTATFIPAYVSIILWLSMSPEGFWQIFVLAASLIVLLGSMQLGCIVLCAMGIVKLLLIGRKRC